MLADLEWSQIKLFVEHATGLDRGTLHVILGVVVQFAAAALLRVPVTRWAPWLIVLAFELVNEWTEFRADRWPDPGMQYGEAAKDVVLTMFLPTLILLVGRLWPRLLVGERKGRADR